MLALNSPAILKEFLSFFNFTTEEPPHPLVGYLRPPQLVHSFSRPKIPLLNSRLDTHTLTNLR